MNLLPSSFKSAKASSCGRKAVSLELLLVPKGCSLVPACGLLQLKASSSSLDSHPVWNLLAFPLLCISVFFLLHTSVTPPENVLRLQGFIRSDWAHQIIQGDLLILRSSPMTLIVLEKSHLPSNPHMHKFQEPECGHHGEDPFSLSHLLHFCIGTSFQTQAY